MGKVMSASKTKSIFLLSLFALLLVFSLFALIAKTSAAESWEKEIKLPFINSITGPLGPFGSTIKGGYELAADEINQAGGIAGKKVSLELGDDGGDPAQAATLVRKFAPTALILLGPNLSTPAGGGFPIANSLEVPTLGVCISVEKVATENRPWTFINTGSIKQINGTNIASWLKQEPGIKNVVLFHDAKDAAGVNQDKWALESLKEINMPVLDDLSFVSGDIDFSAQVSKAKTLAPTGIVIAALPVETGGVIKEIRRQGITAPIIVTASSWTPDTIRIGGTAAEGIYASTTFWMNDPTPAIKTFTDKFKTKYGKNAGVCTATARDALYILKDIIEKNGITNNPAKQKEERTKIREAFSSLKNWKGLFGTFSFNPDGTATIPGQLLRVKNGQEAQVTPASAK